MTLVLYLGDVVAFQLDNGAPNAAIVLGRGDVEVGPTLLVLPRTDNDAVSLERPHLRRDVRYDEGGAVGTFRPNAFEHVGVYYTGMYDPIVTETDEPVPPAPASDAQEAETQETPPPALTQTDDAESESQPPAQLSVPAEPEAPTDAPATTTTDETPAEPPAV